MAHNVTLRLDGTADGWGLPTTIYPLIRREPLASIINPAQTLRHAVRDGLLCTYIQRSIKSTVEPDGSISLHRPLPGHRPYFAACGKHGRLLQA